MERKGFLYSSPPWLHFLFLIGITLMSMIIFSTGAVFLAGMLFGQSPLELMEGLQRLDEPGIVPALRFMQIFQSVGMFIVPALVYFWASGLRLREYLFRRHEKLFILILLALAFGLVYSPLIELSHQLNQLLDLPPSLEGLEAWMRESEEQLEKLTQAFLRMETLDEFLINMLMIALIPAIGEELMFRGALQRIFTNWTGNIHVAIFITAILFSCMHMQFFGFLPRFLIGYLLGYLFFWSGNLWVPVAGHFLNNGLIVLVSFLFQRKIINFDPWEEQDFTILQYVLSAVLTLTLLTGFYRLARHNAETSLNEQ